MNTTNNSQVGVAIIGTGYWGPNLARNYLRIPGAIIHAVCDISPKSLDKFSRSFPAIPTTTHLDKILNNRKISLISIATPVTTHFQIAKRALLAGKHVLIEKPMTKTVAESNDLIALAKKKKKMIMVGHTFIFTSAVSKMKDLINAGELGDIYYFDSIRINTKLIRKDVNVLWDLAPHDISILQYILKERPVSIQAYGSQRASTIQQEIAHLIITYKSGMTAHIHVNWLSPVKLRKILIGGSRKMLVYDSLEPSEQLRIYNENIALTPENVTPFTPGYRSGDIVIPRLDETEPLYKELLHAVDCVQNSRKPITDAIAGREVVRILEASDEALATNRTIALTYE